MPLTIDKQHTYIRINLTPAMSKIAVLITVSYITFPLEI